MDTVAIDPDRLKAGADYYSALQSLGLEPEALFWAKDRIDDNLVLVLVSRYFDIVGPTALSELLFAAFNASATPREIDPFVLRLHSPDHTMIRTMFEAMSRLDDQVVTPKKISNDQIRQSMLRTSTLDIPVGDIYVWKDVRRPKEDWLRKWGIIKRKVEARAA